MIPTLKNALQNLQIKGTFAFGCRRLSTFPLPEPSEALGALGPASDFGSENQNWHPQFAIIRQKIKSGAALEGYLLMFK